MTEWIAISISGLALGISVLSAWLTLMRNGRLKMTQPIVIYFGPDQPADENSKPRLKVYLRTLLFSSSKRGQTVESVYVQLRRGESQQNFSVWVYGEKELARGSGLFVGPEGIAANHHFLLPKDGTKFPLLAGSYAVSIFAKRVIDKRASKLGTYEVKISDSQAAELRKANTGIYFDWGPDQQSYHSWTETRAPIQLPKWLR